jgi:hypothetical protein
MDTLNRIWIIKQEWNADGYNYDILSWSDPGPTLGFMMAAARYMFDRELWRFVIRKPMNDDKKRTNH